MKKYLQNLHTHTPFCDGQSTMEEMIEKALALGFDTLGFSGHAYMPTSTLAMSPEKTLLYQAEVARLKEKYQGKIRILCGLEHEGCSPQDLTPYDYVIGAMHYKKVGDTYIPFDKNREEWEKSLLTYFDGDIRAMVKTYYEEMAELPQRGSYDFVAHFDLIGKHNKTGQFFCQEDAWYQKLALEALHAVVEKIPVLEVNTGAIARGYRTVPYPAPFLLKELCRMGGKVLLTSDCHQADNLDCYFDQSLELIKACGFREIMVMGKNGLTPVPL